MSEKPYYKAVARWFETDLGCKPFKTPHKFGRLRLMEADVAGSKDDDVYACEVKELAYPLGAFGSGSIGQAMVLRKVANYIYIGCVASDVRNHKGADWHHASHTDTTKMLLNKLGMEVPGGFDQYCSTLTRLFREFYGDLRFGLLVVHKPDDQTPIADCHVTELIKPERWDLREVWGADNSC